MINLQFIRQKKLKQLTMGTIICALVIAVLFLANSKDNPLSFCVWGAAIGMVTLTLMFLIVKFAAANDQYRVTRKEVINRIGQMPILKTYYVAQHKILWWRNCRNEKGEVVSARSRKPVEDYIKEKIQTLNAQID